MLKKTLDSVMGQDLLPKKIFVVDQSDNNQTEIICKQYKLVEYVYLQQKSSSLARNVGIKKSEACNVEYWVLIDDDVELYQNYLSNISLRFKDDADVIAVTGWIVDNNLKKWTYLQNILRMIGMFDHYANKMYVMPNFLATSYRDCPSKPSRVGWMQGASMAVRNLYEHNIYLDENMTSYAIAEDRDFSYRLSKIGSIILDPSVKLLHKGTPATRAIDSEKKILMTMIYQYYLMKKNLPHNLLSIVVYYWNLSIRLILAVTGSIICLLTHNKSIYIVKKDIILSIICLLRSRSQVYRGDFHNI